jgi:hypothetical protein
VVFKHVISINSIEKNEFVVGFPNLAKPCQTNVLFVFAHWVYCIAEGRSFGGFSLIV